MQSPTEHPDLDKDADFDTTYLDDEESLLSNLSDHGHQPATYQDEVRRTRETASAFVKNEENNNVAIAMERGHQFRDLATAAMTKIIRANRFATELAELDEEIAKHESHITTLKQRSKRLQNEKRKELMLILGELIEEMTRAGYAIDAQLVENAVEEALQESRKRKREDQLKR